MKKSIIQFGYICDQCKVGKRYHTNRAWTTKEKRNKSMLNHTKKTKHSMFYRTISEEL
jgi:hypothetical protein